MKVSCNLSDYICNNGVVYLVDRQRTMKIHDIATSTWLKCIDSSKWCEYSQSISITDNLLYIADHFGKRILILDVRRNISSSKDSIVASIPHPNEPIHIATSQDTIAVSDSKPSMTNLTQYYCHCPVKIESQRGGICSMDYNENILYTYNADNVISLFSIDGEKLIQQQNKLSLYRACYGSVVAFNKKIYICNNLGKKIRVYDETHKFLSYDINSSDILSDYQTSQYMKLKCDKRMKLIALARGHSFRANTIQFFNAF